jgi:lipopolysaccharide biosynthesis protein/ubiquinone/menaquinone biosynthesis C-methylase UbiE/outer membrane murein-binding lipoprotein Lpp
MMDHKALKPDGERFLPQFRGIIELEHYHRYFLALTLVASKDVLDIASGEGFGSEILSRHAGTVVGVDISPEAVAHASAHYARENLRFLQGSVTRIPLPDKSVDVIVSFETIEHLTEHDTMMSELKRVLRADGCLIISSPNKLVYTDRANYTNPFHLLELYTPDFLRLTSRYFAHTRHYGQRVTTGSVIASADSAEPFTTYAPADLARGVPDQMYDIILASDVALPELGASVFEQPHGPLQPQKMDALAAEVEAKGAAVDRLEQEVEAKGAAVDRLEREVEAKGAAVDRLEQEVEAKGAAVDRLEREFASLGQQASSIQSAFYKAMRDGQLLVQDKWWRRTNGLRKLSNSIRKRKGKPPRTWPTSFEAERYLAVSDDHNHAQTGQSAAPLDGYHPAIPRVTYSDISEEFIPYRTSSPMQTIPRAIAFYLPQFHPFPENDAWWGKGFTEWTNVGKARPMFQGHHQPHCPIHLGYYDLRVPEVMEEQAKLAKEYGISGFAYYFYWFAGKVLMDLPLKQMLGNPKVDIPFCMIWANENWSRRWDGMDHDILIAQKHSIEDSRALLAYLRPFMEDPRYIKVDGKPLFIIYRADIIPDMKETILSWRSQAVEFGFPGLHVVCAQTFGQRDPHKYGFDAAMEFPPHTVNSEEVSDRIDFVDPAFRGSVFSYDQVVTNAVTRHGDAFKVFPTAMLSWDNTARKKRDSHIFVDFSIVRYAQWLSSNAERVTKDSRLSSDEKLIFINAWNEWAEGTHLEPDQKHGYGYLEATRSVMKNYEIEGTAFLQPKLPESAGSEIALIVHLHYEDTWPDLRDAMKRIQGRKPDIFATVTSLRLARLIEADFPEAVIELVDNRGRDIRPFLLMLEQTRRFGYKAVAKIHGKASVYREDGAKLRLAALDVLLSDASIETFLKQPALGLLVPGNSLIEHNDKNMTYSAQATAIVAQELGLDHWRGSFPAGSMFWFRPEALAPLLRLSPDDFDIERGLADGTRAHAIERLFCSVCEASGYEVATPDGMPCD